MVREKDTGITDGNHALLIGWIHGALLAALGRDGGGTPTIIEPEMEGINYTNRISVSRPSGNYTITITKD